MKYIMFSISAILLIMAGAAAQNPFTAIGDAIGGVGGEIVSKTSVVADKLVNPEGVPTAGSRNEFLLGYMVGAKIIGANKVLPMEHALSQYINQVGQTIGLASDYPYPYRGYFFIVFDSADINAFAAPGGFVFITTGMFKFLRNEDELAAILGHEIGHIELSHGMQTLRKSSNTKAISGALQEVVAGSVEGVDLTPVLEPLSNEILKSVQNGYSSDLEAEADARSAEICAKLGYDASIMLKILERFRSYKGNYGGAGYPAERAGMYAGRLQQSGYIPPAPVSARLDRFAEALIRTP